MCKEFCMLKCTKLYKLTAATKIKQSTHHQRLNQAFLNSNLIEKILYICRWWDIIGFYINTSKVDVLSWKICYDALFNDNLYTMGQCYLLYPYYIFFCFQSFIQFSKNLPSSLLYTLKESFLFWINFRSSLFIAIGSIMVLY